MSEGVPQDPSGDWSDDDLFEIVRRDGAGSRGFPDLAADPGRPGRDEALEILFGRYHARVHAQCRRLLGDAHLADDAVQEIFLGLLVRPLRYEGREHFGSWLYVVTRNHCLNVRRRRVREVGLEDSDEPVARSEAGSGGGAGRSGGARARGGDGKGGTRDLRMNLGDALLDRGNPGENAERDEVAGILREACASELGALEQQAIYLRYSWNLKVKEITEVMGLENVSGARSHLATAKKKLRKVLLDRLGEDEIRTLLNEG